jgi:hypothetical protein
MNVVQTFWTRQHDATNEEIINMRAGWESSEYHWMSWALSCLQAKLFFGKVNLVTDERGKEMLIDKLHLPYDNVSTALDNHLQTYPSNLFSLAKIYAYSIQQEPFIHIDGDVIFWQKPDAALLESNIISQNLEVDLFFYKDTLEEINKQFSYIPAFFLKENYEGKRIYASNAGIIGGKDLDFFKTYCKQAFEFIDKNINHPALQDQPNLNFIFEQFLLHALAQSIPAKINYFIEEIVDQPIYKNFVRYEDIPFIKMTHPVGGFKRSKRLCEHLAKSLRKDYPEYYYHIIKLIRTETTTLKSKIYYTPALSIPNLPTLNAAATHPQSGPVMFYERTLKAIALVNERHATLEKIDSTNLQLPTYGDYLQDKLKNVIVKNQLLDLYRLEDEKRRLSGELFNQSASITDLYTQDRENYAKIRECFQLPFNLLRSRKIKLAAHVKLLELGWEWKYHNTVEIDELLAKCFKEEAAEVAVALIPNVLFTTYNEYYLDTLDSVVTETAATIIKIEQLMETIKEYFDPSEIDAHPEAFKQLITDLLKRLLYAGILNLE